MGARPIPRNAACPCGSGKKFKHCCISKGFQLTEDDYGTIRKEVPIPDFLAPELQDHMQDLEQQIGRPLHDDDLMFPGVQLEHVEHQLTLAMQKAGVHPALIYATQKTGLIVSEENQHLISEKDLAEWNAAIEDYHVLQSMSDFEDGFDDDASDVPF